MKTSANEAAPKNLDRALDLLNLLATNSNPMNVMEISKALDVTRTTAYAMLGSLSKKKLVEKDAETGRYSIGYKVLELAECYYHRYPFLYLAEKYIVALAQKWSLKVNVSVLKEPAISLLLASKDPSFLVPRMVIGHIMPGLRHRQRKGSPLRPIGGKAGGGPGLHSAGFLHRQNHCGSGGTEGVPPGGPQKWVCHRGRRVDGPAQLRGRAHSGSLRRLHRRHQLLRQHRNHRCQHAGLNQ